MLYPRFIQHFIGMSCCIHLFPFPVFLWTSRLSGLLLGKLWQRRMAAGLAPILKLNMKCQYSLCLPWERSKAVSVRNLVSSRKAL